MRPFLPALLIIPLLHACIPVPPTPAAIGGTPTAPLHTPVPSPLPTAAPLTLEPFSSTLVGAGERGTVACIHYPGDPADLAGLSLSAIIIQGQAKERDITPETIDGRTCFEMTDALYVAVDPQDGALVIPEVTISIRLTITADNGRALENNVQLLEPGKYVQYPFLSWIFPGTTVCRSSAGSWAGNFVWDLIPQPTDGHPTLVNTPLFSPVTGIIHPTHTGDIFGGNALLIYSPATGYLVRLSHTAGAFTQADGTIAIQSARYGVSVTSGEIVGMIGEKDDGSTIPHIRIQVTIPVTPLDLSLPLEQRTILLEQALAIPHTAVDFITMGLFLDQDINETLQALPDAISPCRSIPWGALSLPLPAPLLPIQIDGSGEDWSTIAPILLDPIGDAASGLDLTAIYTTQDENYLYILVSSGEEIPGDRRLELYLDSLPGITCGFADEMVIIDTTYPNAIFIAPLENCEPASEGTRYYAPWLWESDLELSLPRLYFPGREAWRFTGARISILRPGGWQITDIAP